MKRLARIIFLISLLFQFEIWAQPISGGPFKFNFGSFDEATPISCPRDTYAYGIKSWGAPTETQYCVGCVTGLQLLCAPIISLRNPPPTETILSDVTGFKVAVVSSGSGSKRYVEAIENPDLKCPESTYLSGVRAWGANASVKFCAGCIAQVQLTCTRWRSNRSLDVPQRDFEGLIGYEKSTCGLGSYVTGLHAWLAPPPVRFCISCLTGAEVTCRYFDN